MTATLLPVSGYILLFHKSVFPGKYFTGFDFVFPRCLQDFCFGKPLFMGNKMCVSCSLNPLTNYRHDLITSGPSTWHGEYYAIMQRVERGDCFILTRKGVKRAGKQLILTGRKVKTIWKRWKRKDGNYPHLCINDVGSVHISAHVFLFHTLNSCLLQSDQSISAAHIHWIKLKSVHKIWFFWGGIQMDWFDH